MTGRVDLLFLIMGRNVPSSRTRVLAYLPELERVGWKYELIAGGTGLLAKRSVLEAAGRADAVFVQKKILDPVFLEFLARRNRNVIYDFDDALFADEPTGRRWRIKRPGSLYTRLHLNHTLRRARRVIAGNAYLAEYARRHGGSVSVIPTPVDVAEYHPSRRRQTAGGPVAGWIGTGRNLIYLRRLAPALRAAAAAHPGFRLRVVSDATFELEGVPVENVRWSEAAAPVEVASFDVGLMPLDDDPWSRGKCAYKILQYMAAGVATVASAVGMNREVIEHGSNGYLAGSDAEWADALVGLFGDPDLRARFGRAGRETVDARYSLEACWRLMREALAPYVR